MQNQPYRTLSAHYGELFGGRTYKISLKAGFSCPNRDGTRGTGGCIFCSADNLMPATYESGQSVREQVENGAKFLARRYKAERFIAYFQDFSATYAPVARLETLYSEALAHPKVVGLAVGTRPDCLSSGSIDLLSRLSRKHYVQLELGLQSASDSTLERINRGHGVDEYIDAHKRAAAAGLAVVSHVIIGFPWEGPAEHEATLELLNRLPTAGVKFHCLHVIKGTRMAEEYEREPFPLPCEDEYIEEIIRLLELLDPETVIHRLTGETVPGLLVAPEWVLKKTAVVSRLRALMAGRGARQGRCYIPRKMP